ncbi:MAG: PIN domain-containing protein [Myxococcales bacterium]|nr:PIN domain-containing protein [Myxococcales bacterium]
MGLTLDTGALLALEKRRQRMRKVIDVATRDAVPITVPVIVLAEWWRGRNDLRDLIKRMVSVEPMQEAIALVAGEAMAAVRGATLADAIVMASAAQRGDVVYTSDFQDLQRLQVVFPAVRVLAV